jgi:very-short-patch-repair endonuclease
MLAIEVDGESHEFKKELDKVRQKRLESLGVSFLRFTNDAVKYNIDFVLEDIENWIMSKIGTHPYPSAGGE